ncbi:hypothetical protein R6Q57_027607 [Mikania cordata]
MEKGRVFVSGGSTKDVSYLTNLPGASKRLKIFEADLSKPETFDTPIKGCIGVFHVAHPIDFEGKEPEAVQTEKSIKGGLGDTDNYEMLTKTDFVHVDDVARAHIHLLEYPEAKGSSLKDVDKMKLPGVSSRKLLDTGFQFNYGLEEKFDDAISCCNQNNLL